jgi:hypothetical protein
MPDGDAQPQEPGRAKIGVVVEGERRLAIVAIGPRSEALAREVTGAMYQLTLVGGG